MFVIQNAVTIKPLHSQTTIKLFANLEAVIRRGIRSGLCSTDQLTVRELIYDADDALFSQVTNNENHILHQLLTVPVSYTHLTLPTKRIV